MRLVRCLAGVALTGCGLLQVALAGPPYVADDPAPTDYRHFEIYAFVSGDHNDSSTASTAGIDFNYGAAPNLQLTAVLPIAYDHTRGQPVQTGISNIELAGKYRFLHQEDFGWDVAVFPRIFLHSASKTVGDQNASVLLPLWVERDWNGWATFGGGGCAINHGGDSRNYCMAAWAITRQVLPTLRVGAEVQHKTPDKRDGLASTGLGLGFQYDASAHLHLLGYAASGLQNSAETARFSWYTALLFTF